MASATDLRLPGDDHGTALPAESNKALARQFIASGIDDLAKYRIVRLLYDYQSLAGDVTLFTSYLGFHSLEVTAAILNELVSRGIIQVDRSPGRRPRYRLADNRDVRRSLVRLWNATGDSSEWAAALQILAGLSLEKARARVAVRAAGASDKRRRGKDATQAK